MGKVGVPLLFGGIYLYNTPNAARMNKLQAEGMVEYFAERHLPAKAILFQKDCDRTAIRHIKTLGTRLSKYLTAYFEPHTFPAGTQMVLTGKELTGKRQSYKELNAEMEAEVDYVCFGISKYHFMAMAPDTSQEESPKTVPSDTQKTLMPNPNMRKQSKKPSYRAFLSQMFRNACRIGKSLG